MTAGIVVPPEVENQIQAIDSWWRENRPRAPDLFRQELASCFELLAGAPHAGRRYPHLQVRDVRRVLLRSTRYHVYYTHREKTVVVLAVWSAVRGIGPDLKRPL